MATALPELTNAFNYISLLSDLPNDTGGLTAAELKAKFDQAGQELKEWINSTFTPAIESAIDAAAEGVPTGGKIDTERIRDLAIITAKLGDLAVTTAKLADYAVTTEKLANRAVETDKLEDGAVTGVKLHNNSVNTQHIVNGAVTTDKIANANVTEDKLALNAVTTNKIANDSVNADKIDDTVQTRIKTATVTLASGQTTWSDIAVTGVTATNNVFVAPAVASHDEFNNCGIRCISQGNGTLSFSAMVAPSSTLTVNVAIFD